MPSAPPVHRPAGWRPPADVERDRKRLLDQGRRGDEARALYKTKKWQRTRAAKLAANPLCQCPGCGEGRVRVTPATVVDHIRPHRGDEVLFFAWDNLQSMAKPCHDRKTATEDSGFARRWP